MKRLHLIATTALVVMLANRAADASFVFIELTRDGSETVASFTSTLGTATYIATGVLEPGAYELEVLAVGVRGDAGSGLGLVGGSADYDLDFTIGAPGDQVFFVGNDEARVMTDVDGVIDEAFNPDPMQTMWSGSALTDLGVASASSTLEFDVFTAPGSALVIEAASENMSIVDFGPSLAEAHSTLIIDFDVDSAAAFDLRFAHAVPAPSAASLLTLLLLGGRRRRAT